MPATHRLSPVLLGLAAAAVFCTPAHASTLTADYASGTLTIQSAPGEANDVEVRVARGLVHVKDGAGLRLAQLAGAGCVQIKPRKIQCPASFSSLAIYLGDGADSVDISDWAGAANIVAGPGSKTIAGGSGDDTIDVRNGAADSVSCGAGDDTVQGDPQDSVASDCEHVTGVATPSAGESAPGNAPAIGAPIGLVLPSAPVIQVAAARAPVRVGCGADAPAGCRGDVELLAAVRVLTRARSAQAHMARGHYVAQERRIGKRSFRVARGKAEVVGVPIASRGHYVLASNRHRRLHCHVRFVQRNSAGKVIGQSVQTATLVLPRKWARRVRRR